MSDHGVRRRRGVRAGLLTLGLVVVLGAMFATPKAADTSMKEVTFTKDVAPVVYENCVYCHRPGEVAPFSLLTYKDARPWARSMKQRVLNGQIPPWKADPHYGQFQNTKILSKRDIDTIVAWVDGGAKEGDPSALPAAPQFADGWQIGTPDLVLTMKEPFTVAGWFITPSPRRITRARIPISAAEACTCTRPASKRSSGVTATAS
jgi:hypothetical protein